MNKRRWALIIVLLLIFMGLLAWLAYPRLFRNIAHLSISKQTSQEKIVIGIETWPGYFPLLVAQAKGYFKEAGLNVEIKRYPGLGELSKDYVAGRMQGRANLTLDAIKERLDDLDHKAVLVIDYSNGSDAIVAQTDVKTVKDFRGKQIAYEPGTLEEFFLTWALTENDLRISDIVSVHANPEETAKKLANGDVAAGVTHEPFLSRFVTEKNLHVVYSSADAPGLITDILTFRSDFIEKHPEMVRAIVKAYFRALQLWKSSPSEVYTIMAKEFGDTPESIAKQLQGITMLDIRDNQTAFTFSAGLRSLFGNMRQIGEFVQKHHTGKEVFLDTDKLIERKFVKNLNNQP